MLKRSTFFKTYSEVLKILPPHQKRHFWLMMGLILITSVVDLAGLATFIPIISAIASPSILEGDNLLARLKNSLGIQDRNQFIVFLFVTAFLFLAFRIFFIIFSQKVQARFVFRLSQFIGSRTYNYYLNTKFEEFAGRDSATIVRELTISPMHFARFLVMPLLLVSSEVFVIILIILGIAVFNIQVFLLLVGTLFPSAYIFQMLIKKKLRGYGELENEYSPKLYSTSTRGVHGYIDVKLRNKENKLVSDYINVFKVLNSVHIKTAVLTIIPSKLFELVTIAGLLLIVIYGFFWADDSTKVLPLITLYAAAGYRVIPSLTKVMPALMQLEQYRYLFRIYHDILSTPDSDRQVTEFKEEIGFEKDIQLNDILFYFRSSKKPLFAKLNLNILKGEIVGIIGRSGSGKTTLVNLITGFYQPTSGDISIDGKKLSSNNMISWRNKISYVQQSSYLEKGSLASNIAFLENNHDGERMRLAIKGACLDEFVGDRKPEDVFIEEAGKNLSGGQKQRVIIARALYHQSQLIILDEATSALDNETEDAINETIRNLRNSSITIIIIAHRYSTLKHTDRIIKMSGGVIESQLNYADIS